MRLLIFLIFLLNITYATTIESWMGETITINVSMKNTTHLIFDEEIISEIYPKEENVNIMRNGKNVFFRYNPFIKYKITKSKKKTTKSKDGVIYKGSPVKIWFVGAKTGTNYAIEFNPTGIAEDTYYIKNKAVSLEEKVEKLKASGDLKETREKRILSLVKKASKGASISGYDLSTPNIEIESNENYQLIHSKSYVGLLYDIDVYTFKAKREVLLNEFEFLNLPKDKKVFIGLSRGWKKMLEENKVSNILIVSEK